MRWTPHFLRDIRLIVLVCGMVLPLRRKTDEQGPVLLRFHESPSVRNINLLWVPHMESFSPEETSGL